MISCALEKAIRYEASAMPFATAQIIFGSRSKEAPDDSKDCNIQLCFCTLIQKSPESCHAGFFLTLAERLGTFPKFSCAHCI